MTSRIQYAWSRKQLFEIMLFASTAKPYGTLPMTPTRCRTSLGVPVSVLLVGRYTYPPNFARAALTAHQNPPPWEPPSPLISFLVSRGIRTWSIEEAQDPLDRMKIIAAESPKAKCCHTLS